MVEKRLVVQGSMALGLVDLEKAFDTVPREMVVATLRWIGVPESDVRMVEGTYEKTTAIVLVGEGASEQFEVNIELREGSVLRPMLFIAVLDLINRKTVVKGEGCHDETPLCRRPGTGGECQTGATGDNGGMEQFVIKHGLKLDLEKTEVLHIGHQRE